MLVPVINRLEDNLLHVSILAILRLWVNGKAGAIMATDQASLTGSAPVISRLNEPVDQKGHEQDSDQA